MCKRWSLGLLLLTASAGLAAQESAVVLRCGRLIDPQREQPILNATVLTRGERIVQVGENVSAPAGAPVLDLSRATCLPGLIDLHAHILHNPGEIGFQSVQRSSARKALDGLRNARKMLLAGFTTLRDPGDFDAYYASVEVRNAIERGDFVGPRLLVAPHLVSPTGGHGDLNELAPDAGILHFSKIVDGADNLRRVVREQIKYGADWIKLMATGGVMSARDDPRVQAYTDEELRAAVDETHRHGKKITVHAIGAQGIKAAVRAGVDSVEHGILIDEEGIQLMKQRGTVLVPTLYVLNYVVEEGERRGYPPDRVAKGRSVLAERDKNIRAAFAAGVKVAFGSDTIFPHDQAAREFALLVRLGLTPLQAIRAATLSAAELLGLDKEIGTIETGKLADIIAVADNPLQNIRTLEEVKFVMKKGQIVKNDF